MKIDKSEMIGTVPLKDVRDFFKKASHDSFTAGFAEGKLSMSPREAVAFFELLQTDGWIEVDPEEFTSPGTWFRTTVKGNALKLYRSVPRIGRARADKIIVELKQRCEQVNKDDYYLCSVQKLVAFGSFASDSLDVGDIDLFLWLEDKEKDRDKAMNLSRDRAREKGVRGGTLAMYAYGQRETELFLKARSRYISFSRPEVDLKLADKIVTIFEAAAAVAA
jgi:hypothetical protein